MAIAAELLQAAADPLPLLTAALGTGYLGGPRQGHVAGGAVPGFQPT